MEFEVAYNFENEQQFWDELHETLSRDCETNTSIDDALRSYLKLTTSFRAEYIRTDYDLARCSYNLHNSTLFQFHSEYVRKQIIHCLLQDEEPCVLQIAASFLLADAEANEITFEVMNNEGAFPRLVDLISEPKNDDEAALHRLLMELLYEMSRIQKIKTDDLLHIQDDFIRHLFQIIEQLSSDVSDPYHYPVIRVLLVLNEQFMVAAHDPDVSNTSSIPLTNKVMKLLCSQGNNYKTFGENIILVLNREDETSLQLLTLKLLYLLFTTPQTYEYFYTNDLRVLVDILIRNLLDLPEDASALRHTYLRVLYPLLAHTQLRNPPQYKRDEIRKLLTILARGHDVDSDVEGPVRQPWGYFGEVDETTKRLVGRCQKVAWLMDPDLEPIPLAHSPIENDTVVPASPASPMKGQPPALPSPRKLTKRNSSKGSALSIGPYLTPDYDRARQSSLSMMEMAAHKEKPGVITPSRNPSLKHNLRAAIMGKKDKPPPPKARRSGHIKTREELRAETQIHSASLEKAEMEAEAQKVPESTLMSKDTGMERPRLEPLLEAAPAPKVSITPHKDPPPMPKARRWRGRHAREEGEGGGRYSLAREPGKFSSALPSIKTTNSHEAKQDIFPFIPVTKTLSLTAESARDDASDPTTVVAALGEAQAEAISGIGEALEKMQIVSPTTGPTEQSPQQRVTVTASRPVEESEITEPRQRLVLAPPGLAPPRAIPGPKWELEKSPFLSDEDEGDEGNESGEGEGPRKG